MSDTMRATSDALAPAYLDDDAVCPRNPLVRALKPALASLRTILPQRIYAPLYAVLFSAYKAVLRQLYLKNVVARWLGRDPAGYSRAKRVYSVMPYSLVGASGLEATFDAASDLIARGVPGSFVECGVARGGCAALMATVAAEDSPPRKLWLFDSFEGLPDPTPEDYKEGRKSTGSHIRPLVRGSCLGTRHEVERLLFSRFKFTRRFISLVQGWFQDTLPAHRKRIGQIALLRIDGDWYESTICCLDSLYDNVSAGGAIVIDDYGVCYGCKKAVHEFFAKRGIHPHLIPDGRGGIRFLKDSRPECAYASQISWR